MSLPLNQVLTGTCVEVMKTFPNDSIDMAMFSPPYYGLRDYHVQGQIGLESTWQEYIVHMVEVCRKIKRVLKKTGSMYLVIGDTYSSMLGKHGNRTAGFSEKTMVTDDAKPQKPLDYKPKCLMGIPWRLAFALIDDNWILRNDAIWHKPNAMPSSVKDRLTQTYEHIFFFVKSRRYYFDLDAIRQPHATKYAPFNLRVRDVKRGKKGLSASGELKASKEEIENYTYPEKGYHGKFEGFREESEKYGSPRARTQRVIKTGMLHGSSLTEGRATHYEGQVINGHPSGKNPGDFWSICTKPFKGAHFSVYPEEICIKPILSSCPPNGIVLDPMCGSGTTLAVAKKLGRRYVGIDLNPKYVELAKARLSRIPEKLTDFL